MDQEAKNWILQAFADATLAAYYVDLQKTTQNIHNSTFNMCAKFMKTMTALGIKNRLIALTPENMAWKKFTVKSFHESPKLNPRQHFAIAAPDQGIAVYTKSKNGAFDTDQKTPLEEDIQTSNTSIWSGVYATGCVLDSLCGLLEKTDDHKAIVALDLTDFMCISYKKYKDVIKRRLISRGMTPELAEETINKRVKITSSLEIQNTLKEEQRDRKTAKTPQPAAQHHKPHQQPPQPVPHHHLLPSRE